MLLELLNKIVFIIDINLLFALIIAFPSGLIQGYAGFGGTLVAVPFFAILFDPVVGFAIILVIVLFGQGYLFYRSTRLANWRETGPAAIGSAITMSLGITFLVSADPYFIRNGMAVIILIITGLLMSGWNYPGNRKPIVGFCIGSISGGITGGFGVPAFPMTASYLLSSNDQIETKRANVLSALACGIVVAVSGLIFQKVYNFEIILNALVIAPTFIVGSKLGERIFILAPTEWFSKVTYLILIFSAISLFIFN